MKSIRSKDGTTLAYDVYGNGPALIYITGAICFRNFKPVLDDAKIFAREFTMYNYDRRGRGDSSDTLPYSIDREIEDIEAMIDAAGGSAFLYGHSSGAVLALEAARRIPSKISKVSIYDASYVHDEREKSEYAVLCTKVSELVRQNKNAQALRTFLIGIGMPKFFVYLLPLMPGWKIMKALAPTLEYDMLLTRELPPTVQASEIKVPMQIIYGEKSPAGIHSVAHQLAQAIPGAQLKQLDGQDHMASAKALLPVIAEFLKG